MTQRKNETKPVELKRFDRYHEAAIWLDGEKVTVLTERMLQEHAYEAFTEKYLDAYVSGDLRYDIGIPDWFFTDGIGYLLQSDGKWYACVNTEKMYLDLCPQVKAISDAVVKELYERLEIDKIRKFAYTVIKDFTGIAEMLDENNYDYPPLTREENKTWVMDGLMEYDKDNGIYDDIPDNLIDTLEYAKTVRAWWVYNYGGELFGDIPENNPGGTEK